MNDREDRKSIDHIAVKVTPAAEHALREGFPWIYRDQIREIRRPGRAGDLAIVFDRRDRFAALGLLDPDSPIIIRILHRGSRRVVDETFFREQFLHALAKRESLVGANSGYRLIYGESDGFPGLVVDRYGSACTVKLYTAAWRPHLDIILTLLRDEVHPDLVVERSARNMSEGHSSDEAKVLVGVHPPGGVFFLENGLTFRADLLRGQKTGFFLDQRDNRSRVESLAMGADVLNVCSYTGGFSLYAARGGARHVVSLDISRKALEEAAFHFELNRSDARIAACRHETVAGDAFEVMAQWIHERRIFDVVILDPPAFARNSDEVEGALRAYRKLAELGCGVLRPGGTLVAASCSSRINKQEFFDAVVSGAERAGYTLDIFETTGHPVDHPAVFVHAEYLKCLYARIRKRASS